MYGIMLVNQAGETVASVGWDQLEGDISLFGGFVSAVQMFIKRVSGGTQVNEMVFGDMKLLIGSSKEYHVITLHQANETVAVNENRQVVELIDQNNSGLVNEGILDLIKELIIREDELSDTMESSVREWTQSQLGKAKKAASDWGKTVF
jgi:hypothetical protein